MYKCVPIPAYFDFNRSKYHLSLAPCLISFFNFSFDLDLIISLVETYSGDVGFQRLTMPFLSSTLCSSTSVLKYSLEIHSQMMST